MELDDERIADVVWLRPDGSPMAPADWDSGFGRLVGMFLNGQGIREKDLRGRAVTDVNFIVYFNSGDEPVDIVLPDERHGEHWHVAVDTAGEMADGSDHAAGTQLTIEAKALLVLQEVDGPEPSTDDSVDASLRMQNDQADGVAPAPRAEQATS